MSADDDVREWEARGRRLTVDGRRDLGARRARARRHGARPAARVARLPVVLVRLAPSCSTRCARERRVVAVDFLGFGLSDKPDLRYSMRLQADVVEGVARELGLTSVALLTHDMGDTRRRRAPRPQPRRNAAVRGHAARAHQRQHLHRHGAPHDRPSSCCCRSTTRPPISSSADGFKAGLAGTFSPEQRGRRRRARSAVAARAPATTATACCPARSATSRTAAPRSGASPARSRPTRRRSASCGARTIRSRSSR